MTTAAAAAPAALTAKQAKLFGEQLQHDPMRHANNAVVLLQCLQEPLQEVSSTADAPPGGCCASAAQHMRTLMTLLELT